MNKRFGFTLAEVLITLGIIGVVAAMTIPNLIANTNSARFSSGFKKALASVAQVGEMGQAHYDFDFSMLDGGGAQDDNPEQKLTLHALLNGTLSGKTYLAASGSTPTLKAGGNYAVTWKSTAPTVTDYVQLADGSMLAFNKDAKNCTIPVGKTLPDQIGTLYSSNCGAFIDVNGVTLPNKEVTCTAAGSGSGSGTGEAKRLDTSKTACEVKRDNHLTDVFPIVFHDGTAEPATDAAMGVFTGK